MEQKTQHLRFILIAAVLVVNAFVFALLAYKLSEDKVQQELEVRRMTENTALLLDHNVTEAVGRIDLSLHELTEQLERQLRLSGLLGSREVESLLAYSRAWLPGFAELRVTDDSGELIFGPEPVPGPGAAQADRDFFMAQKNRGDNGLIVTNPMLAAESKTMVIWFTRRYNHPDGRFGGSISAAVPVSRIALLLSGLDLGPRGVAVLRDTETAVIARYPVVAALSQQPGAKTFSRELADIIAAGAVAASYHSTGTADGVERINAYRRLSAVPFHLVAGMASEDYLADWKKSVWEAAALAVIFLAVTVLLAWLLWRSLMLTKRASERSRLLLLNASDGIHILDGKGVILEASDSFCRMLGFARAEVIGMSIAQWDANIVPDELGQVLARRFDRREISTFETRYRRKDGSLFEVEVTNHPLQLDDQQVIYNAARDITARKKAEDEIRNLAFYDPLTRLPNRRLLLDRLKQALAPSTRNGRYGALLFIDLDDFKTLNDTLGHDIGDLLLQRVAEHLASCVREGDSVARLGADEFVVMLEYLSEHEPEAAAHAETVGEKILATLNHNYQLADYEHHSTASIGITLFTDHHDTIDDLLKQADLALHQAKAAGRNSLRFFEPEMQSVVTARAALEAGLREALRKAQFLLYYQAQVDGESRVTGAEVLLRWQHPQRGMVSPAEFIPLAEATGLILPLGHWVLETACRQLAAWAGRGKMADLTVAVNVSARQFYHKDFVADVLAILDQTGANPKRLKLELTESLLLDHVEDTIAKMTTLRASGVCFSLDDFGTGYSSLAYLKRLPLDQLKIDQSFVRDVLTDSNDAAIARTVIALGKNLGLAVIAEGVESAAQRDFLAENDCAAYQGYLFGRPMPRVEFENFVAQL